MCFFISSDFICLSRQPSRAYIISVVIGSCIHRLRWNWQRLVQKIELERVLGPVRIGLALVQLELLVVEGIGWMAANVKRQRLQQQLKRKRKMRRISVMKQETKKISFIVNFWIKMNRSSKKRSILSEFFVFLSKISNNGIENVYHFV